MHHDIVVIGASAGGIDALRTLLSSLPADLPAAVFVVVHMPPEYRSLLPSVFSRSSPLPASYAGMDEHIQHGRIYLPLPDHHLLVEDGRTHNWRGPKENRHRPAINPLFRSAAVSYRNRVVGVVLTGTLDDGAAGLWWIASYGGVTIVQDPAEALFSDMPKNALETVDADHVVRIAEMAPLIERLVRTPVEHEIQELPKWRRKKSS
jgi:two-component system chemotaxis response regulator CheB